MDRRKYPLREIVDSTERNGILYEILECSHEIRNIDLISTSRRCGECYKKVNNLRRRKGDA